MKKFFFGLFSAYFIFPLIENIATFLSNIFQYYNTLIYKKIYIIKDEIQKMQNQSKQQNHPMGFITDQKPQTKGDL